MAYAPITGTGTGVAPVVNISWPFLDKSHVSATANGSPVSFTWTGASQITFSAVVANGVSYAVNRVTPKNPPVVVYGNNAVLNANDMDNAQSQYLYALEELSQPAVGAALLAANNGSSLIGFQQNGTGSVVRTVQAKLFDVVVSVVDYGADPTGVADSTTAIQNALAYVGSLGGGVVKLPVGTYKTSSPIDIKYPRVQLVGPGNHWFHDAGTEANGIGSNTATIAPNFAGTALRIRSPYASELGVVASLAGKNTGAAAYGFKLAGGGIATMAVEIDSVSGVNVDLFATGFVGTTVYNLKCGVTGTDLGEACDIQHSRLVFRAREIDTAAEQVSDIVTLNGSSNANVSGNRGPVYGIHIHAQHKNGHVLRGKGADNNDITVMATRTAGGTGNTVYAHGTNGLGGGFYANAFRYLGGGGPIFAEGTDTSGVTSGITNVIEHLDTSNGTPYPTAGVASYWETRSVDGDRTGLALKGLVVADSSTQARTQRANLGNGSLLLFNGSSNHVQLTDGTNTFGLNISGGNLRILRLAGSGLFDLTNVNMTWPSGNLAAFGSAAAANKSFRVYATDLAGTTFTYGAIAANGGSRFGPIWSDGTNWREG